VDKQRRQPPKLASIGKADVVALWTDPATTGGALHAGHFALDVASPRAPSATAAPGLE
jgi:hypothetical protein